jgi:hypothetical protein
MLINKGVCAGEVVTVKLINGEEIIARYLSEDDTGYVLEKVLALSMNQQGMGLIPYCFTLDPDSSMRINKSSTVIFSKTAREFADQYLQSTSSIVLR